MAGDGTSSLEMMHDGLTAGEPSLLEVTGRQDNMKLRNAVAYHAIVNLIREIREIRGLKKYVEND